MTHTNEFDQPDAAEATAIRELISHYAATFYWLHQYDVGLPDQTTGQPGGVLPTVTEVRIALAMLRAGLSARGEASDLFAQERGEALVALLGNLDQTVFGQAAYPSIEAKAAHLLYFVVKDHPFADGNKRSAAFLLVDFLRRNQRLCDASGVAPLNPAGLAALTLLVAESSPADKDRMITLVMSLLVGPP